MAWEPDRKSNILFSPPANLCAVTCITEITNSFVGTNSLYFFGLLPLFFFSFLHVPLRIEDNLVSLALQLYNSKIYLLRNLSNSPRPSVVSVKTRLAFRNWRSRLSGRLGKKEVGKIPTKQNLNSILTCISGVFQVQIMVTYRNVCIYSCFCSNWYFPRYFCCHWYFKLPANYNLWVMT